MAFSLWRKNGETAIIVDANANPIWCETCPCGDDCYDDLIDSIIKKQRFDLWLFLEPDVKWVSDGIRYACGINERKENNMKLKSMLDEAGIEYHLISGSYSNRFNKAINIINELAVSTANKPLHINS